MAILECKFLTKSYHPSVKVLDNISLSLPEGRILGLLGPNGSGKSTLMKLIAGVLQPDSGTVTVDGFPVGEQTKALVSYLPERTYFAPHMKVEQLVSYFTDFYKDFDSEKAKAMLLDLAVPLNAKLGALSKGTKEKVQLVMVMARQARLYLLDEPIGGVDPVARDYVLSTLISNYNRNASMIITTHLIRDVEACLDDFIFMGTNGQFLKGGDVKEHTENRKRSLDDLFREMYHYSEVYRQ